MVGEKEPLQNGDRGRGVRRRRGVKIAAGAAAAASGRRKYAVKRSEEAKSPPFYRLTAQDFQDPSRRSVDSSPSPKQQCMWQISLAPSTVSTPRQAVPINVIVLPTRPTLLIQPLVSPVSESDRSKPDLPPSVPTIPPTTSLTASTLSTKEVSVKENTVADKSIQPGAPLTSTASVFLMSKPGLPPILSIPLSSPSTTFTTSRMRDKVTEDNALAEIVPPVSLAASVSSMSQILENDDSFESTEFRFRQAQRRTRRTIIKERKSKRSISINYGSEGSSDESDEDLEPQLPREFRSFMEMSRVAEPDILDQSTLQSPTPVNTSGAPDNYPLSTFQPNTVYDFHWTDFPETPFPPESRREKFSYVKMGPTTRRVDPYYIFISIWDRQFMDHIASETNRYAGQEADENVLNNRRRKWLDTTADELYVYFAIIIAMGVVVKPRFEDYWRSSTDIFSTPGFRQHMTATRFIMLNKYLHFVNNEDMRLLHLNYYEAKIFKIQPVLSHLNTKFQRAYNMGQNIAVDEGLLRWSNKCILNKDADVGIKSYELYETQTGYMWRCVIQTNNKMPSQQSDDTFKASALSPVLNLLQGLENKGHTVWMGSLYNSPCLARHLKLLGFDCAGPLRTDRKFVPHVLDALTEQEMAPYKIIGHTSGDVDIIVWLNATKMSAISTYHGNTFTYAHGTIKPIVIRDFNIMMSGMDKKDRMLAAYPIERKRIKIWYKKLFRRLLNVSVLNAYIIHRQSSLRADSTLSHQNFRMTLVKSLLSNHKPTNVMGQSSILHSILSPQDNQDNQDDYFTHPTHRLAKYCKGKRLACRICKRRTFTYCAGCDKPVCIGHCFAALHSN